MAFNLSMMTFAGSLASLMLHASWLPGTTKTLGLVMATVTLFLGQTGTVAGIVAVSEGKSAGAVWWGLVHLSFPYYVVSAGVTSMVQAISSHLGWGLALAVFPVMYGIHCCYKLYFSRMVEALRPGGSRQSRASRSLTDPFPCRIRLKVAHCGPSCVPPYFFYGLLLLNTQGCTPASKFKVERARLVLGIAS